MDEHGVDQHGVDKHGVDEHRAIAERAANDLAGRDDVLAVLLSGSVCRGEHMASSDIDLLVVTTDQSDLEIGRRQLVDGLLLEWIARPEADFRSRFDRPRTSWLYAFLEAEIVMDSGPAARLVAAAKQTLRTYRTAEALRELLATQLWHGQAKLDRAEQRADARELGFWSAVCTERVIDGLFAVYDVPLPAGARRLEYLHLVPLTDVERSQLDRMLTGTTVERFEATRLLQARLRAALGSADHQRNP